jgi:predicted nucleotidyltransferase component of viral defense system
MMHSAVDDMLKKYSCSSIDDYRNALKEIIQEITLLGLFRSNFFDVAAFYGGTSLRIFYGLERFSEDLDFSLIKKNKDFNIEPYCSFVKDELASFGFNVEVSKKYKNKETNIESAFIKGGTLIHLLNITGINPPVKGVAGNELMKIKLEVDTDPPGGAGYEVKYQLTPVPFSVKIFDSGSLFAGKVHAVLCRGWKSNRVKGRDLYDFIWYLSRSVKLNIDHLEKRMRQSGHVSGNEKLGKDRLIGLLKEKFDLIDYEQAKRDVIPFIKDQFAVKLWSKEFFQSIVENKLEVEKL